MIGQNIQGFTIQSQIAKTTTGIVYQVQDTSLQVVRAMKLLHPNLANTPLIKERTIIAWKEWARLDNHSFAKIYEAIDTKDHLGMVMDYVEGENLATVIKKQGRLGITQAVDYFLQIAKAIHYAHQQNVLHRKISSSSIQISKDETIRILGLGALRNIKAKKITPDNLCVGKVYYMAPEQFQGIYTPFTEQYMLGILFYEMLTGRLPYKANNIADLYKQHLTAQPIAPNAIYHDITIELQNIVLQMIAKKPENRFASITDIINLINEVTDQIDQNADLSVQTLQYRAQQAIEKRNIKNAIYYLHKILAIYGKEYEHYQDIKKQFDLVQYLYKEEQEILKIRENIPRILAAFDNQEIEKLNEYLINTLILIRQYPDSSRIRGLLMDLQREIPDELNNAEEQLQALEKEYNIVNQNIQQLLQDNEISSAKSIFQPYKNSPHPIWKNTDYKIQRQERIIAHREYYCKGLQDLHQKKYLSSILNFKKLLEINPNHRQAQNYLEIAQKERENEKIKKTAIEKAYKEGCQYFETWNFPDALIQFQEVLQHDPEHQQSKQFLTIIQERLQDENKVENIAFFYQRGKTFYDEQKWKEAIVCFQFILNAMPNHKPAKEYQIRAEQNLENELFYNKQFDEAQQSLKNENYTQALQIFTNLLQLQPDNKEIIQYKQMCEAFLTSQ